LLTRIFHSIKLQNLFARNVKYLVNSYERQQFIFENKLDYFECHNRNKQSVYQDFSRFMLRKFTSKIGANPAMIGMRFVPLAIAGGSPRKIKSGRVTAEPLLASVLIKPLRIPAIRTAMVSIRDGIMAEFNREKNSTVKINDYYP